MVEADWGNKVQTGRGRLKGHGGGIQGQAGKARYKLGRQKTHKRHAEEGCENAEAGWESMVVQVGRGRFRRQRQADHRL